MSNTRKSLELLIQNVNNFRSQQSTTREDAILEAYKYFTETTSQYPNSNLLGVLNDIYSDVSLDETNINEIINTIKSNFQSYAIPIDKGAGKIIRYISIPYISSKDFDTLKHYVESM